MIRTGFLRDHLGYTLIELVMIIVLLGLLVASAAVNWPTGMKEEAAVLDFIRAVRYAQHLALTREYDPASPTSAWGIIVAANEYDVKRADDSDSGDPEYQNHVLPGNTIISTGSVWFNGLGEPIDITTPSGDPLTSETTFSIGGTTVTVFRETGYVE